MWQQQQHLAVAVVATLLPHLIVGPAVTPVSFVTLEGPELVGGSGDASGGPVCCQDPHVVTCQAANIQQEVLGQPGSIGLPGDIVLGYVGNIGGNAQAYEYKSEDGAATATITCSGNEDSGCHGQATSPEGQSYVLEYCGPEGHVWKVYSLEDLPLDTLEEDKGADDNAGEEDNELVGDTNTQAEYSIKFYYTSAFAAVTPDVGGFIAQAVAVTNQAYKNSKVPIVAKSLCREKAASIAEGDMYAMMTAFEQLKGSSAKLRDSADVAVLLIQGVGDYCGLGQQRSFATGDNLVVVAKGCVLNRYTLAHEIGHNFGLGHDPANMPDPSYPYATGHLIDQGRSKDPSGVHTIMAYSDASHRVRVNFFSSPSQIYPATGTALGVAGKSDNVRVLLLNRLRMAAVGNEKSRLCTGGREVQPARQGDQADAKDPDDEDQDEE